MKIWWSRCATFKPLLNSLDPRPSRQSKSRPSYIRIFYKNWIKFWKKTKPRQRHQWWKSFHKTRSWRKMKSIKWNISFNVCIGSFKWVIVFVRTKTSSRFLGGSAKAGRKTVRRCWTNVFPNGHPSVSSGATGIVQQRTCHRLQYVSMLSKGSWRYEPGSQSLLRYFRRPWIYYVKIWFGREIVVFTSVANWSAVLTWIK